MCRRIDEDVSENGERKITREQAQTANSPPQINIPRHGLCALFPSLEFHCIFMQNFH